MLKKCSIVVVFVGSVFVLPRLSLAECPTMMRRLIMHLGFNRKVVSIPPTRFESDVLHSFVVPVLRDAGWVPEELLTVQGFHQTERFLARYRKNPRVIALLEIPFLEKGGELKKIPNFWVQPSSKQGSLQHPARQATNLEIFEKHFSAFQEKYLDYFKYVEEVYEISPNEFFANYLKYAKSPLGVIQKNIDSNAKLFKTFGLGVKESFQMAVALGHVPTSELHRHVAHLTRVFNSPIKSAAGIDEIPFEVFKESDFIVSYATKFGSLSLSEIDEVSEAVHVAAFSVQRGALSFLEVIARLETRLGEALFRMQVPSVNKDFSKPVVEHEYSFLSMSPWRAFKERMAWSFADRKIVNESAIQKIRNVFMIDQIYTLICEGYLRGTLILTSEYERYKFIANLVTFGLNDFLLGWTGVQTATDAFQKSKIWKDAKTQFLKNRHQELSESWNFLNKWAAFKEVKKDQLKRYLEDYPFPSEFSDSRGTFTENLNSLRLLFDFDPMGFLKSIPSIVHQEFQRQVVNFPYYLHAAGAWGMDFASQGKVLFLKGGTATAIGISGVQFLSAMFQPDENVEVEDRVITVLWTSFMVATWMATSSNLRYTLVLKNLQNYWEKKFPTLERGLAVEVVARNQRKQILRTRIAGGANALVGGLGFIAVWQRPLDGWFEGEGGGHDQVEELWEEFVQEILPDGEEGALDKSDKVPK